MALSTEPDRSTHLAMVSRLADGLMDQVAERLIGRG